MQRIVAKLARRYAVDAAREADISQIFQVYNAVRPTSDLQQRFQQRFRHKYLEHPHAKGLASVLVCRDGERLIGFAGMMDFDLWYHDRLIPATFSIDLAVLPAYQGVGIGYLLLKRTCERQVIVMDGHMNDAAQRLAERMGGREIAPCTVLRRWSRPSDVFHGWSDPTCTIEENATIDRRFDHLWAAAREIYEVIGARDQATLAWKFKTYPLRPFTVYTLCHGQQLVAYVVTTMERLLGVARKGILVDYLFAGVSPALQATFLSFVLGRLARKGALCVDVIATHHTMLDVLTRLGFVSKGHHPHFMVYTNTMAEGKIDLWQARTWHLTFGDSDFYLT